MLLPSTCPICRRPGRAPCPACAGQLARAPALPPPPGVDWCHAVLCYDGDARMLVASLKYRNARSCVPWMSAAMATLAARTAADAVVTWVPATAHRLRATGFDQAELLARRVARHLRRPCRALLVRGRGPPQTGRSRAERRLGPRLEVRGVVHADVLLVDDVVTTGSSVAVAARALRRAGAPHIAVVAAARTPPGRSRVLSIG